MSQQLKLSFPTPAKIKKMNSVLSHKEKFFFYLAVIVLMGSIIAWSVNFYINQTKKTAAYGGEYIEGVVGAPSRINPIATVNPTDQAISRLIYSSLFTYDKDGKIANDLAESYQIEDDGKRYKVKLKENATWHDKEKVKAEDIEFTVKTIQDAKYHKNPVLKSEWKDIEVSTEGENTVIFQLKEPFSPFLNRLTFGVLPKHIFKDITTETFLTTPLNLEPVGSGPFIYSDTEKDSEGKILSYRLVANKDYYNKKPYLDKITFNFYSSLENLHDAYNKKQIQGFYLPSGAEAKNWENRKDTHIGMMHRPFYVALLFNNTKSVPLAKKEVRDALVLATNREELVKQTFGKYATTQSSPILNFGDFSSDKNQEFDYEEAENKLEEAGWKKNDVGIREKDGEKIEFSLLLLDSEDIKKMGNLLAEQWLKIGVKINLEPVEKSDMLNNHIQPREYQAIMLNYEYTGNDPEPSLFFHSKYKNDPGHNLALYENEKVDKLLVEAVKETELEKRQEKYKKFEKQVIEDSPGIFLCSPLSAYILNQRVKGYEKESLVGDDFRFVNIADWYVKTARVKKGE